jgi:hypothetical protein
MRAPTRTFSRKPAACLVAACIFAHSLAALCVRCASFLSALLIGSPSARLANGALTVLMLLTLGAPLPSASATTTTFAQFTQDTSSRAFGFTNDTIDALPTDNLMFHTGGIDSATVAVPINFQFDVANGYGPANQTIKAELTLSAIVASPAVGGSVLDQPLKNMTLTITADTPVGGHDILLQILPVASVSTGQLFGISGTSNIADTSDTSSGGVFQFASQFLGFGLGAENYTLGLTGMSNAAGGSTTVSKNANGFLNSFVATGTETFAATSTTSVPEPSAWALLTIGAFGLLSTVRRRTAQRG